MENNKKSKMIAAILSIVFIVYNFSFFAISGFSGHGPVFWMSYALMIAAFLAITFSVFLLRSHGFSLKDWLFGYPLVKHSAIYLCVEFLASTAFCILEKYVLIKWGIAFSVQLVILSVYLIFAISCFLSKQAIDEVHTAVKDKTTFLRLLKVDADMLVVNSRSEEARKVFSEFANEVKYSDPISSEVLFELEKDISLAVSQACEKMSQNDESAAVELCQKAYNMLLERNKKTQVIK